MRRVGARIRVEMGNGLDCAMNHKLKNYKNTKKVIKTCKSEPKIIPETIIIDITLLHVKDIRVRNPAVL